MRKYCNRLSSLAVEPHAEIVHEPELRVLSNGQEVLVDPVHDERSHLTYDMFRIDTLVANGVDLQEVGTIGMSPLSAYQDLSSLIDGVDSLVSSANSKSSSNDSRK